MPELKRILHVDDDPDILEISRIALSVVDDFEVLQCSSGAEGLDALKTYDPDLLLLDVMMPAMTGVEFWKMVCDEHGQSDLPVIFMTAKVDDSTKDELLEAGALGIVSKPFDPMSLGGEIRRIWGQQNGANPA